ncbi:hypothetical protein JCM3775_004619 [Rhodotorula graminis]|uniref:AB hydrolase-1 domain-containing protein n=1 Tax=Rhodotorula graminis (strain WP1) TaxID=578459 RepID=A0A194S8Y8_RHOGW|nr:uncharacterized protein RHOBADRAFT_51915 [Rhodotorula graminis WP1]KPV76935.1 hypothetical protein RHOBADRAFT_51915 [Rhodotorula graminis WP1]
MDNTPTAARTEQSALPPAYLDPHAYLHREQFHRQTTYTPSYAPAGTLEPQIVSYAVAGSTSNPTAPVVVWLNGMGGHRLAATLLDGIFASRGVRLVTLDRPSAGKSTPVPLPYRVPASLDALVAVLAAEHVSTFSLLSHSNGILYALYTLRHLPKDLSVRSWHLSSPYVPPWLSGSVALSAARWIPAPLVGQLGTVAGAVQRLAGPLERGMGWSSAAVRDWGGWASMGPWSSSAAPARPTAAAASTAAAEDDPELLPPPKQLARFRRLNAQRPPHKRLYGGYYLPPGLFARGMQVAIEEGLDAMGQEAMLCLRQGGARWVCPGESEAAGGGAGAAVDEGQLYERAFEGLRDLLRAEGREVELSAWCGEDDALVPEKGRRYLRALLVDRLEMVDPSRWHEIEDAGHDDTLGLSCVIEPLLDDVLRVHEQ